MGELRSTFRNSDDDPEVCNVVIGSEENPFYEHCYKCALGAHGCCYIKWQEGGVHYTCGCGCKINPKAARQEKETW